MRFWLAMGVDGFRVDAVYWMAKDPFFRNDPVNPTFDPQEDARYDQLDHKNSSGWPAVYAYLSEMAEVLYEPAFANKDRFMVTEAYPKDDDAVASYLAFYEGIDPQVAAPFNFQGLVMRWEAGAWRRFLRTFHHALEAVNPLCVSSYAFGNHDQSRTVTRLGEKAARSAAVMQLTLPGMAFIYYGEEIGMHDVHIPKNRVQDPNALGDPRSQGRDPERTPMQWSAEPNAGFSTARKTWLPVADDYKTHNVETETKDPQSFYALYRRLLTLRNRCDSLRYGLVQVLELGHPDIVGYVRSYEDEHHVVLVNFSGRPVSCVPGVALRKLILSSAPGSKLAEGADGGVTLLPYEAALFSQ
jgi:alpha-glucosidase